MAVNNPRTFATLNVFNILREFLSFIMSPIQQAFIHTLTETGSDLSSNMDGVYRKKKKKKTFIFLSIKCKAL